VRFFRPDNWTEKAYYRIRTAFNASSDRFERAVRFIYLNRFGCNGVYRVNANGEMNTPYGHPKSMPGFP
jgi:DNA adenine methylase